VALSVSGSFLYRNLPVRKQDALCCPDFPPSRLPGTAIERPACAKVINMKDLIILYSNKAAIFYFCYVFMENGIKNLVLVFIGSGLGGACRYLLSLTFDVLFLEFPVVTLSINTIACFLVGLLVGIADTKYILTHSQALFISTGFCGAFSSFARFSRETINLFYFGNHFSAILNIILSIGLCLVATYVGLLLSNIFFPRQ
jgi:CrcB protein